MSELKPCPFCGNEAEIISDSAGGDFSRDYYYPWCPSCKFEWSEAFDRESDAIKAWNRRAPIVKEGVE